MPSLTAAAGECAASQSVALREVVTYLRDVLGGFYVAVLVDERSLDWWITGRQMPDVAQERCLRAAYDIYWSLLQKEDSITARQWFMGTNPLLGDESPLFALKDGRLDEVRAAAETFIRDD